MSYYIDSLPFIPYPDDTNPMDMTYEQKQYQNTFKPGEPVDLDQFNMMDLNREQKQALFDYNANPKSQITTKLDPSYGLNREEKSGLRNFNNGLLSVNETKQAPKGIFGDWGSGSQWNGLLNMPENNFNYESQGFNYEPQPFNYTPQAFDYTPQPFNYLDFLKGV